MFIYNDDDGCGVKFAKACRKRGVACDLFREHSEIPDGEGFCFFANVQLTSPEKTHRFASLLKELNKRRNLVLIPTIEEWKCLRDKCFHAEVFSSYLPRTLHLKSADDASGKLGALEYPFVSKSHSSFQSKNVRLIKSRSDAEGEISLALSGEGIPMYGGGRQKGYLLWQEFLPGNRYDLRVVMLAGKYAYLVRRFVRDNIPLASGSGKVEPVKLLDHEAVEGLNFALEVARSKGLTMAALDLLRDREGNLKIIETHCAWGMRAKTLGSVVFKQENGEWVQTEYTAGQILDVMAQAVAEGAFN